MIRKAVGRKRKFSVKSSKNGKKRLDIVFLTCYNNVVKNETQRQRRVEKECLRSKSEKTKALKAHFVALKESAPATVSSAI